VSDSSLAIPRGQRRALTLAVAGVVMLGGAALAGVAGGAPRAPRPHWATSVTSKGPINPAAIPLGDGHVTTSPTVGSIDSCTTAFGGGGADASVPWIDETSKTWDSNTKLHVGGAVAWPAARFSATRSGSVRVVRSLDLPVGHTTGVFPISSSDPAYAYDQNPNRIEPHAVTWRLSANPSIARHPSCLPLGPIGIMVDGVLLFDALDGVGRDAVAHEVLDRCDEHPAPGNLLHHHDVPACLLDKAKGTPTLVGYALDGFGIYVERNAKGQLLTNTSLNACHGRVSTVQWDGTRRRMFHYDATAEYPYTVGCFEGSPIKGTVG
jgi:YHYH protein